VLDVFCITDPFDCGEHWEVEGHGLALSLRTSVVLIQILCWTQSTGNISMENLFVRVNVETAVWKFQLAPPGDWLGEALCNMVCQWQGNEERGTAVIRYIHVLFCLSHASTSVKFQYEYMVPMQEEDQVNRKASLEDAVLHDGVHVLYPHYRSPSTFYLSRYPGDTRRNILLNPDHACQRQTT